MIPITPTILAATGALHRPAINPEDMLHKANA